MAKTALEWVERVFKPVIRDGRIIIAEGKRKIKVGGRVEERPTGAGIFVEVDTFAYIFKEEILAGGEDAEIAARIATKKVKRAVVNPETGEQEDKEFDVGYGDFIEKMTEKGLF